VVSFPLAFLPITYTLSSSSPFVLHAPPISSSFTLSFQLYLAKSTNYEAPHYAVSSTLPSLLTPLVQIFSAPYSQTTSVCVSPLMSETNFHSIQNSRQNCSLLYSINNNTFFFATIDKVFYSVSFVLTTCFGPYISRNMSWVQRAHNKILCQLLRKRR
jgi:hypothetical protein